VVNNAEVGTPAGVDDAWIRRKTGIVSRRWADDRQATSDLAYEAARAALEDAGIGVRDLSLIVVATSTPDSPQPPTAAVLARLLGAPATAAAFDLNAVCSGFVFALDVARRFLNGTRGESGGGGYALVIGGEVYSRILDRADRRTTILLGDGAGAAVVGPGDRSRSIIGTRLLTFGDQADLIKVPAGGSRLPPSKATLAAGDHYFRMQGRAVAEFVHTHVPKAVADFLAEHHLDPADVDHLVPHQANGKMIETLQEDLGLPQASTHATVRCYGNTGAASVAITLDAAARAQRFQPGDIVLLAAFGGGMSAGLALLRW
jgi:3-oxoacyl-(acyl-carrier-protein) synthase III